MIKNITKNTVVSKTYSKLRGFEKITGLIGKKKPKTVVFKTRFGIHTFFLNFPIDVILLDSNKQVVFIKRNVKPNKIVIWNIKFNTVIELPESFIKVSKTQKGDILDFNL